MESKTYSFDESTQTLTVFSNTGVHDYCEDIGDKEFMMQWCIYPKFNSRVIIDSSVTDCSDMFKGCNAFNQPIVIPDSVTNCDRMFWDATSFNQELTIPASVTSCNKMFNLCKSLATPITIPATVVEKEKMFDECPFMRSDGTRFVMQDTPKYTYEEFAKIMVACLEAGYTDFVGVIVLTEESCPYPIRSRSYEVFAYDVGRCEWPYKAINAKLYGYSLDRSDLGVDLRQYIGSKWEIDYCYIKDPIPKDIVLDRKSYHYDTATNTLIVYSRRGVIDYCRDNNIDIKEFNQSVVIDPSVKECSDMFCGFFSFNQPITVPEGVQRCSNMFFYCRSFNQPVALPSTVTDCQYAFSYCDSLTQRVTAPETAIGRQSICTMSFHMNEDGTPRFESKTFTFEEFCITPDLIMPLMSKGIDHRAWFKENFPNGATSKEEVLSKIMEE